MTDFRKQGKRNLQAGREFEKRVRADLEFKGWIISRWCNNLDKGICIQAKQGKFRKTSTGFPDFFAYREMCTEAQNINHEFVLGYEVIFVECKTRGYLSKEEKEKALWYLNNGYCSKFLIAKKSKKGRNVIIEYKEVKNG